MQYFIFLRVLITIPSLFHRFLASFFKLEVFLQYLGILGWLFTFKCQMLRGTEEALCVVGVARGGVSPLTGRGVRFHWRNSCLRCQCQSMETFSCCSLFWEGIVWYMPDCWPSERSWGRTADRDLVST